MIKIHECEQGSEQWHELRTGKFTGTAAAKLLKHGAIDYSLTERSNFRGNWYTKRGHELEPEALELYELITKTMVGRPGFVTNNLYPDCGYSPDGLVEGKVIEVKCFMEDKHKQLYNGDIPFEVLAQIHFGMMICERKAADLIIYNPELEPKLAFKIIPIKASRGIVSNFKRILKPQGVAA
jgi:hypothetical protein